METNSVGELIGVWIFVVGGFIIGLWAGRFLLTLF
jgi:hypothetical protein